MRWKIAAVSLTLTALLSAAAFAAGDLAGWARLALQGSPAESAGAVQALRQAGPAGMKALLAACPDGACRASQETLDKVCGVRDCADIRLFWYTDLEAARAAAHASGKPILSLRLMGRLDEEMSCANSRFFRTVFYKNRSINRLLRDGYVLYWRSMRPVPRVTIDFGDGNRIEQPLTGNSIHYVLDSKGRLLESLPGLYGPAAFELALKEAEEAARAAAPLDDPAFKTWAAQRYQRELDDRAAAFGRDLRRMMPARQARGPVRGFRLAAFRSEEPGPEKGNAPDKTTARDPWAVLMTTPGVLSGRIEVGGGQTGAKLTYEQFLMTELLRVNDEQIDNLARLRRPDIHLDEDSRAFMLRKQGVTDPESAARLVDNFETSMARDEVINEYRYSPVILQRLIDSSKEGALDLEAFNFWVYKEVFRTPLDDPWLGLVPKDTYGALPAWTRTAAPRP